MKKSQNQISATEFKKHCLSLIGGVKNKHSLFIIAKRKVPIAQIVPLPNELKSKKKSFLAALKVSLL